MTVYAITDTKKGEQGLRLLIFILPKITVKNNFEEFYQKERSQMIDDDDDEA